MPTNIGQSFTDAQNAANAANEARYQLANSIFNQGRTVGNQLFDEQARGYQARYQRGMDLVNQFGEQQRVDARRQYAQFGAAQDQAMISRGLGNTTARTAVAQGNNEELSNALGRINEQILRQRFAADAQLSGDYLGNRQRYADWYMNAAAQHAGLVERRTDEGPNFEQYRQLAYDAGMGGWRTAAEQAEQQRRFYELQNLANVANGFGMYGSAPSWTSQYRPV
jgi:hypothetical protein